MGEADSGPISVLITGLAAGGDGVGRVSDGRVAFVDGGVPGERVELAEVRGEKRFIRAKVGRVIDAGPNRVEPRCPHFERCGGCRWQHVSYSAQLEAKRTIVRDALERIGGLHYDEKIEIVPSPDPYGYRARARWVESGEGLGFRARGSRDVSPIRQCPVLVPSAERALVERARAIAEGIEPGGGAPQAETEGAPSRKSRRGTEWIVTAGEEATPLVRRAKRGASSRRHREAPGSVSILACGEKLRVSSESFVQGNALLWDAFATAVRDECLAREDAPSPLRFVELYAGIGFFTLALARAGHAGVALESDRSALSDLRFNLRRSGLEAQVEVLAGRVEGRGDLAGRLGAADILLVDPPRVGLETRVRAAIGRSGPGRMVYVSCDPATLARDLRELCEAGYSIRSLRAFDLFPQTPHVETVVRLERAKTGVGPKPD